MNKWQDYFFFSKGERWGVTILFLLGAIMWLLFTFDMNTSKEQRPLIAQKDSIQPKVLLSKTQSKTQKDIISKNSKKKKLKAPPTRQPKPSVRFRQNPTGRHHYKPYKQAFKYPAGTVIELNGADTTELKKIPGIGSSFAKRIKGYGRLLGGYHSVAQLKEVYGIDTTFYQKLKPWFKANSTLISAIKINHLPKDSLLYHPYLSRKQAYALREVLERRSKLTGWQNLKLLKEFSRQDIKRLSPYISFE